CTPRTLCQDLFPSDYPMGYLPGSFGRHWPTSTAGWKQLIMLWMGSSSIPTTQADYFKIATSGITTWNNSPNNFLSAWGIMPLSPIVMAFIIGEVTINSDKVYTSMLSPLLGIPLSGLGEGYGGW